MKKQMYSLMVVALFAAATMASAHDLPYEQDGGTPDDPVPTVDAVDLGGGKGLAGSTEASDLGGLGMRNQINNWIAIVTGYIVTLPNRSQIIG